MPCDWLLPGGVDPFDTAAVQEHFDAVAADPSRFDDFGFIRENGEYTDGSDTPARFGALEEYMPLDAERFPLGVDLRPFAALMVNRAATTLLHAAKFGGGAKSVWSGFSIDEQPGERRLFARHRIERIAADTPAVVTAPE